MRTSEDKTSIVFQSNSFCFVVGKNGKALSLKLRGEELLCDSRFVYPDRKLYSA